MIVILFCGMAWYGMACHVQRSIDAAAIDDECL